MKTSILTVPKVFLAPGNFQMMLSENSISIKSFYYRNYSVGAAGHTWELIIFANIKKQSRLFFVQQMRKKLESFFACQNSLVLEN